MARLIGIRQDDRTLQLLRAFGARKIGSGITMLANPGARGPRWSRAAGNIADLAALGMTFRLDGNNPQRAAAAAAAVLGVMALDAVGAQRMGSDHRRAPARRDIRVSETITVNKPIEQVYAFWRAIDNLPRFMRHLDRVEVIDSRRSRWHARGPAGIPIAWDAEIVDDRDQDVLAWRSVPGSRLRHHGRVKFQRAPGARGTEVRIELEYHPPGGSIGRTVGWLFGRNPEQQLREDLRRFKQLLETGEMARSDGPGLWRPAQPRSNASEAVRRTAEKAREALSPTSR